MNWGAGEWVAVVSAALALASLLLNWAVVRRQTQLQFESLKAQMDADVMAWAHEGINLVSQRFVNVVSPASATIPREDVARLLARFDEIGFDRLRDQYRGLMTDLPTTTITLVRDGRRKVLVDYGGTSVGMPRTVRDLQAEIDRVAGTAQWVLRDGQPVRERPEP